jgi:outer membrane protein assembly factor BamA
MIRFVYIILLVLALFPSSVLGDEPDSLQPKRSGFLVLPVLFYSPETKLAGGAAANYYFREPGSSSSSRPSTIVPSFIYTQRKQIISELSLDLYWWDEAYRVSGYVSYKKFPDKFYGIGNNTPTSSEESYTPLSAQFRISIQKRIRSGWNVGIHYEYEHSKLVKIEPGGLLAQGGILGSRGGAVSGAGLLVNRDTRDNIFYPTGGGYAQFGVILFNSALASDYDFTQFSLDVRQYVSLSSSQVIAVHGYANTIAGEPPFQKMSMLGGRIDGCNVMRGYYEGRYRDKHLLAFQIEYRIMPVWWKLGLVAFAGWGDVSDAIAHFRPRDFKYAAGCGVRLRINQKEKLNFRIDFAYGRGASGMYITIGEAF